MTEIETGQVGISCCPGVPAEQSEDYKRGFDDGHKSFKESKHRSQLTYLTKKQKIQVAVIAREVVREELRAAVLGAKENSDDDS